MNNIRPVITLHCHYYIIIHTIMSLTLVRHTVYMGHSTGTDKFLSAQEYHSQMVFFYLNLTNLIICQGHDVIAVINIPNLKCLI